ncbi:MAG: tRNA 2-thiouridine synthesizing protein A [Halieaceae bacterium]
MHEISIGTSSNQLKDSDATLMSDQEKSLSQSEKNTHSAAVLDTRGLRCPEPVMLLHKAIAPLLAGQRLTVLATDPTTQRDIPQFCRFLGHELASNEERDGEFVFILVKGA